MLPAGNNGTECVLCQNMQLCNPEAGLPYDQDTAMNNIIRFVLQFALSYGVRDKARFTRFANELLDDYAFDAETKDKLVAYLYDFCHDLSAYLRDRAIAREAVQDGLAGIEHRLDELTARFEELSRAVNTTKTG